jgi:hypothetical protein
VSSRCAPDAADTIGTMTDAVHTSVAEQLEELGARLAWVRDYL